MSGQSILRGSCMEPIEPNKTALSGDRREDERRGRSLCGSATPRHATPLRFIVPGYRSDKTFTRWCCRGGCGEEGDGGAGRQVHMGRELREAREKQVKAIAGERGRMSPARPGPAGKDLLFGSKPMRFHSTQGGERHSHPPPRLDLHPRWTPAAPISIPFPPCAIAV